MKRKGNSSILLIHHSPVLWVHRLAPTAKVFLVGTKCDDADNAKVKVPDGVTQAKEWNIPFKSVSAKTGLNVQELFSEIVDSFP